MLGSCSPHTTREVEFLRKFEHANVVKLIEAVETPNHYHVITKLVHGVTLEDYTKTRGKLDLRTTTSIFTQHTSALNDCHNNYTHLSSRNQIAKNVMNEISNYVRILSDLFWQRRR